jgi:hypothetical protein
MDRCWFGGRPFPSSGGAKPLDNGRGRARRGFPVARRPWPSPGWSSPGQGRLTWSRMDVIGDRVDSVPAKDGHGGRAWKFPSASRRGASFKAGDWRLEQSQETGRSVHIALRLACLDRSGLRVAGYYFLNATRKLVIKPPAVSRPASNSCYSTPSPASLSSPVVSPVHTFSTRHLTTCQSKTAKQLTRSHRRPQLVTLPTARPSLSTPCSHQPLSVTQPLDATPGQKFYS